MSPQSKSNGLIATVFSTVQESRQWRTLAVAMLLTATILPIGLIVQAATGWSTLVTSMHWLHGRYSDVADSWMTMFMALDFHREHGEGLYQALFFEQGVKFQYPPSSLLPLMAMEAVGLELTYPLLNVITRVILLISVIGVALLTFRLLSSRQAEPPLTQQFKWLVTAYVFGAALLFYPSMMPVAIGQVQVWINCLFIFACLAWFTDRRILAGVLIGLICMLKPQFALFGIWALLRKEWHFAAAMFVVGMATQLTSVVIFGFHEQLEYVRVLSFISQHGETFYPNQSVNGLLNRLVGHDPAWQGKEFAPYNPIVYYGTLISSVVIILLAMFSPRPNGSVARLFAFQFAAVAFTIASPIAWEHHYGVMAPMFAGVFAIALIEGWRGRSVGLVLLAVAYVLNTNYLGITNALTGTPFNILQSYQFFGVICMMILLWALISRRDQTVPAFQ